MDIVFYPALLFGPGEDGGYAVTVPGINVNGQGASERDALLDAAEILQEVVEDLAKSGRPIPGPGETTGYDDIGPSKDVVLQAKLPAVAA